MSLKEKIWNRKFERNGHKNKRKPLLKSPDKYERILVITNTLQTDLAPALASFFTNSKLFFLYKRLKKEDTSGEREFTFHKSDVNLTGKIKNDKLNQLLQMSFDLVLDLSDDEPITTFLIKQLNQSFMIGKSEQNKSFLFDLISQKGQNDSESLNIIKQHLTLLSQYGNK